MQAFVRGGVDHISAVASTDVFKPFDRSAVTRIGAILRKTSLDELPQLANILLGEMSLALALRILLRTILCVVACKGTH
jgi:hypothetical protein